MVKIQIRLTELDFRMLRVLSDKEYRDPRQQAGILIREALEKRGLLAAPATPIPTGKQPDPIGQEINHERQ